MNPAAVSAAVSAGVAATEQQGRHLPLDPWAIGLGAFLLLATLLLITLSFGKDR